MWSKKFSWIELNSTWVPAALVALVFWAVMVFSVASNVYQVAAYRPVHVEVISKGLAMMERQRRGRTSYVYEPIVEFRYRVDGETYTGRRVTPLAETGTREWAEEMLAGFQVGQTYEGYYSTFNPSDAYLVKRYDARPFCLLLPATILLLSMGAAALLTGGPPPTAPDPMPLPGGWFQLGARPPPPARPPAWLIVGAAWYGLGLITLGPYFVLAAPNYDGVLVAGALGYALAGAGLVAFLAHDRTPPPDPISARVLVDQPRLVRGATVVVRVELRADYELPIDDVALGLAEGTPVDAQRESPPQPADWTLLSGEPVRAQLGQPLVYTHPLTLPNEKERYGWLLVVRTRSGMRDYRTTLPIYVQSPPLLR